MLIVKMGNNESSPTRFELLAKKDILDTNMITLNVLIKREYQQTPVNIEKIREYKKSLAKLTKQIEKIDKIVKQQNGKR